MAMGSGTGSGTGSEMETGRRALGGWSRARTRPGIRRHHLLAHNSTRRDFQKWAFAEGGRLQHNEGIVGGQIVS